MNWKEQYQSNVCTQVVEPIIKRFEDSEFVVQKLLMISREMEKQFSLEPSQYQLAFYEYVGNGVEDIQNAVEEQFEDDEYGLY